MPGRRSKHELAIRRQEAGLWYDVALWLTVFGAAVGGIVSIFAFHAPTGDAVGFFQLGKLLRVLIYGSPGFAPFFALYLILWYNPPRKKAQEKPPTTPGGPTD
jgi:hypothetical protein